MAKTKSKPVITDLTFSEVYLQLKELNNKNVTELLMEGKEKGQKPGELNLFGRRYYVYPQLEYIGLDTWQKVYDEATLIRDNKSKLSRSDRDTVVVCFNTVVEKTNEINAVNKANNEDLATTKKKAKK